MTYTNVSVKGGKVLTKALSRLASKHTLERGTNVSVGEIVLNALAKTYSDELIDAVSFFDPSGDLISEIAIRSEVSEG